MVAVCAIEHAWRFLFFAFRFVHAAVDLCTEEYESKQMVPYLALLLIFHIK